MNTKKLFIGILSTFLLFAFSMQVSAQTTWYVSPDGDDNNDGESWATAFATPQKAFSSASTAGDIIAIKQGTYIVNKSFENGKSLANIRIQGGYTGNGDERIEDPNNTILEYENKSVRVLQDYANGLVFNGVTFQNITMSGYGVFVQMSGNKHLTLESCIVKNIKQTTVGNVRAIFRFSGNATLNLIKSQVVDCSVADYGVIARNTGPIAGNVNIFNSVIRGTSTKAFLHAAGTNVMIANSVFVDNSAGAANNLKENTKIYNSVFYDSTLGGAGELINSYSNKGTGSLVKIESESFNELSDVFSDEAKYYPAFALIDAGDNAAVASGDTDLLGGPRIQGETVDIGAIEMIHIGAITAGDGASDVSATLNGESVPLSGFYGVFGDELVITFTKSNDVPAVNVAGASIDVDGDNCVVTIPLAEQSDEIIVSSATQRTVTVNHPASLSNISTNALGDNPYLVADGTLFSFEFDYNKAGHTLSTDKGILSAGTTSDYVLTVDEVTENLEITITETPDVYSVTLIYDDSKVTIIDDSTGEVTSHGDTYIITHSVDASLLPHAWVNGRKQTVVEGDSAGEFKLQIENVQGDLSIRLYAFPENAVPVAQDTYLRRTDGSQKLSGDPEFEQNTVLETRGNYVAIPLFKFNIPDDTKALIADGKYNKVSLSLTPTATFTKEYTVRQVPITETLKDILSFSDSNGGTSALRGAPALSATVTPELEKDTPYSFDITDPYSFADEVLLSLVKTPNSDPLIHSFHSLENGNPDYVPVLIFSTIPQLIVEDNLEISDQSEVDEYLELPILVKAGGMLTILGDIEINDLEIQAGGTVQVNAGNGLTVNGDLIVDNDGELILINDLDDGAATIVGNVTSTATITQVIDKYRSWYMSVPMTSVTPYDGVAAVYEFEESLEELDGSNKGWTESTGYEPGKGLMVNPESWNDFELSFKGTLHSGNLPLSGLTSGKRRFHYLGNPYPSYLNWSDVKAKSTDLEEIIWFRTQQDDEFVFAIYNGETGVNGGDNTIAPMQGFWVRVNSGTTGSVTFENAMRKHASNLNVDHKPLRAPQEELTLLRLEVSDGTLRDETVIYFKESNSDGNDGRDAAKMMNNNARPEIWTTLNGEVLAINAMQNIPLNIELPLGFNTKGGGSFTISAKEFTGFSEDIRVLLLDKTNGVETDLTLDTYDFDADAGKTNSRFAVKFAPNVATGNAGITASDVSVYNVKSDLMITLNKSDKGLVKVYSLNGQQLASQTIGAGTTKVSTTLEKGVYLVSVEFAGDRIMEKIVIR